MDKQYQDCTVHKVYKAYPSDNYKVYLQCFYMPYSFSPFSTSHIISQRVILPSESFSIYTSSIKIPISSIRVFNIFLISCWYSSIVCLIKTPGFVELSSQLHDIVLFSFI